MEDEIELKMKVAGRFKRQRVIQNVVDQMSVNPHEAKLLVLHHGLRSLKKMKEKEIVWQYKQRQIVIQIST